MKTLSFKKKVANVSGLMEALKTARPPFAVVNVGADQDKTLVWLDDSEKKNPSSIVEAWVDGVSEERQAPTEEPVLEPPVKASEEVSDSKVSDADEEPKKPGFFSRLLKGAGRMASRAVDEVAWWQK